MCTLGLLYFLRVIVKTFTKCKLWVHSMCSNIIIKTKTKTKYWLKQRGQFFEVLR